MKVALLVFAIALGSVGTVTGQDTVEEPQVEQVESLRRGQFATVQVEVVRITDDDEMIVRDETGRLRIYVSGVRDLRRLVSVGEVLTITGTVDDDRFDIPRELYAEQMVREDGTVIEVSSERWD